MRGLAILLIFIPLAARADLLEKLRQEQSLLATLDRHLFEARRAEGALKAAAENKAVVAQRLAAAKDALEVARRQEARARELLKQTLRLAAQAAPYGTAASVLLGPEGDDVMRRKALYAKLAARQAVLAEALAQASEAAAVAEFRAAIENANAHATLAAEAEARETLQREIKARQAMLEALEKDRVLAERHAAELSAAERALIAEIQSRLSTKVATVPLDAMKGKMRNPMSGSVVEVPFGDRVHPVFKTVTPHPGLTFKYNGEARNVRAVAFGRVVHAEHVPGLGLTLVLDHASGWYSVYAGLTFATVSQGAVVREGDVIGRAERGPGEDAVRLYFELRRGPEALDPEPFLARGGR